MDDELKNKFMEWIKKEEEIAFAGTQEQYQGGTFVLKDLKEFIESLNS